MATASVRFAIEFIVSWVAEDHLRGDDERLREIMDSSLKQQFLNECQRRVRDPDYDEDARVVYQSFIQMYA